MLNARNLIVIIRNMVRTTTPIGKDPETKRLKKKYIGRHHYPAHEQENVEGKGT